MANAAPLTLKCALLAAAISTPALAQDNLQGMAGEMNQVACQGYRDSLINMVRTATTDLSPEAFEARNEAPINNVTRQKTMRSILEGAINSESNPALRRILTEAANDYLRSQRLESFEQGLQGFVAACVQNAGTPGQRSQPTPDAPAPSTSPRRDNGDSGSSLPARKSYL